MITSDDFLKELNNYNIVRNTDFNETLFADAQEDDCFLSKYLPASNIFWLADCIYCRKYMDRYVILYSGQRLYEINEKDFKEFKKHLKLLYRQKNIALKELKDILLQQKLEHIEEDF